MDAGPLDDVCGQGGQLKQASASMLIPGNMGPGTGPSSSVQLGTVHDSRTLMLADLSLLVDHLADQAMTPASARQAVIEDNVLGKKTVRTREASLRYLTRLYTLDEANGSGRLFFPLFRTQQAARGQLAALQGLARDRLLQVSLPVILKLTEGQLIDWPSLAVHLRESEGNLRATTLKSSAQNLLSSWGQGGWLSPTMKKRRILVTPLPEAVAFALYLGYIEGRRGLALLDGQYFEALGSSPDTLDELAYQASRRGYLTYRRIADVLDIQFPKLTALEPG